MALDFLLSLSIALVGSFIIAGWVDALTNPLLVPCPLCNGLAVRPRAVWVYKHGCAFGHYDTEEDECPECEGSGRLLVEGEPITMEDLETMGGIT